MMAHHKLEVGKGKLTKRVVEDIEKTRVRLAKFYYGLN